MNYYENSRQKGDMMTEASSETTRYYVFKTDSLSVNESMVLNKEFVAIETANDHCYDQAVFCEPEGNWDDCFHSMNLNLQLNWRKSQWMSYSMREDSHLNLS